VVCLQDPGGGERSWTVELHLAASGPI
jgi:hypothetical protein